MDAGLLSLKWNNHSSTFFHVLETIRKKELYSDVTIACDGKFFAVHKLVLSTCSDYFQEMFEKTQCKHPVIVLKDISHTDLESLLNYMYLGEVNVLQNELSSLIKAAECLRVKGLAVPDEPPPSKKSSKRQCDREENSSSKRNRRSATNSTDQSVSNSDRRSDAYNESNDLARGTEKKVNQPDQDRLESENQSPTFKEFDTLFVKEEKPDEVENFNETDVSSVVKFEQFDDTGEGSSVGANLGNNESNFPSQQPSGDGGGGGQNFPSTSGYDESSNWSGDIETIDDDDDMGVEAGTFDPNSFLDPSQAKSQMGSNDYGKFSSIDSPFESSPTARRYMEKSSFEVSPMTRQYMKREDSLWKCLYPQCCYTVYYKSHLAKHIRRHTGERPFICSACPYSSADSCDLYRHTRTKHHIM